MKQWRWLITGVLLGIGACRDAGPDGVPPAPPEAAAPGAVTVRIQAPDTLGWNQEDSIRVTVANGTAAPHPASQVELYVAEPVRVLVDSTETAALSSTGDGALLEIAVPALAPGASHAFTRRIRMPAAPRDGDSLPRSYRVRASLAGRPMAEDTLHVQPGSEAVAGGCASPAPPSAQRYGVGPVRVGMSARALRGACPEARDTAWELEGMPERGLVASPGGVPILAMLAGDSVHRIEVSDPRVQTAAGVGVGTPLATLRARYGRPCGGAGEGVVAVWFQNAPGISFLLDSASTHAWFTAPRPPEELPDSATVARFLIHGQDPRCPAERR